MSEPEGESGDDFEIEIYSPEDMALESLIARAASTYRKTSESISILCLSLLILLIHRVTRIPVGWLILLVMADLVCGHPKILRATKGK